MRSYECGGPGEYFGGLRMCLRSHSRDCAGKKHWAELRMRTTTMHVCAFLILVPRARRFLVTWSGNEGLWEQPLPIF